VVHIAITTDSEGHASVEQTQILIGAQKRALPRHIPAIPLRPALNATGRSVRAAWARLLALSEQELARSLFALALLVYLSVRLIGLTDFPIYFFGDEAVQTVSAADLVKHGFRGSEGELFPTYFQNGNYYNLSTSVYLQVIPHLLFGNSIFVTRATSVLVTLLAALAIGLILRNAFDVKHWWVGTLLFSAVPAWFLHSRTAFETALFVSFYAAFLYFYLEYRLHDPKKVYYAVVMAGLAFYTYSPGQLVLATTAVFLLFNDLKYHWQQRNTLLVAIGVGALIAVPYIRFRLSFNYSPLDHLRQLGSYWIQPIPLSQKILMFLGQYLRGLSPFYWFSTDSGDLVRHQMLGYGHLPLWMFPLLVTGVVAVFLRFRSTAYRVILLAALAAPTGAALAEIGITRVLVFVVPASILAALGLDFLLNWVESWLRRRESAQTKPFVTTSALAIFTLLAAFNLSMLSDALRNGPTWYTDYGLYGMQFGAKQIYEQTVIPVLKQDPQARFVITPSWANGAEQFVGFFVPPEYQPRVMLGQIYDLLNQRPVLTNENYFIVSSEEYNKVSADPKFKDINVRSIIHYPDGRPGFYVINLNYSENVDAIIAAEEEARRKPVEETFTWNGQEVRVVHSPLGGGSLNDMMDGNTDTLAKGAEANPVVFEYFYSEPIPTSQLVLTTGSMQNFDIVIRLYAPGSDQPVEYTQNFQGLPPDPTVIIEFPNGPAESNHIFISIKDNSQGKIAQVHVREITFK
jgi:hypothetical protein